MNILPAIDLTESGLYDNEKSADFNSVEWNKVTVENVRLSDSGSSGVVFVSLKTSQGRLGSIVVKGSGEPARELFLTRVARLLNISCPAVRVYEHSDPQLTLIKRQINRSTDRRDSPGVGKVLRRPQILLMEFVEGSLLNFVPEAQKGAFHCDTDDGRKLLHSMAKVLALDTIANNYDRLPLLWNNRGNYENVIVQPGGRLIAIDNTLQPILKHISGRLNQQYNVYIEKLRSLLDAVFNTPHVECEQIVQMRQKLANNAGIRLTSEDGLYLQLELVDAYKRMARVLNTQVLEKERDLVANAVRVDWLDVWRSDASKVSLEWMGVTLGVVKEFCN